MKIMRGKSPRGESQNSLSVVQMLCESTCAGSWICGAGRCALVRTAPETLFKCVLHWFLHWLGMMMMMMMMAESTSYNMTLAAHERVCAEDEEGGESCCCIQVVHLSGLSSCLFFITYREPFSFTKHSSSIIIIVLHLFNKTNLTTLPRLYL